MSSMTGESVKLAACLLLTVRFLPLRHCSCKNIGRSDIDITHQVTFVTGGVQAPRYDELHTLARGVFSCCKGHYRLPWLLNVNIRSGYLSTRSPVKPQVRLVSCLPPTSSWSPLPRLDVDSELADSGVERAHHVCWVPAWGSNS